MMARSVVELAVPVSVGLCLWLAVCLMSGASEPWDAEGYWTAAYPGSIVLAGMIGFRSDRRGWLAGLVLTLMQFPVMVHLAGTGPMVIPGLMLLCALAVPAAVASTLASRIGRRVRRRR